MRTCLANISALPPIAAFFAALISHGVFAHHGRAHYGEETVEMAAEIIEISWRNPHITFQVRAINEAQEEETWELESGSKYVLGRTTGATSDMFNVGDRVRIAGQVSSLYSNRMLLTNALLPDGREARMMPWARSRWVDASGAGEPVPVIVMTDNPERSLFRTWSQIDMDPAGTGAPPGTTFPPLTDLGKEVFADYDFERDNPDLDCIPPGMPSAIFTPHPIQFIDEGERITQKIQENDIVRTIWMNGNDEAAAAAPSPLGYSAGHWEGMTLVVRTTNIDWPFFNGTGAPLSDRASVLERYEVSGDGSYLHLEMETTDPLYLAEGVFRSQTIYALLGEEIEVYDCVWER